MKIERNIVATLKKNIERDEILLIIGPRQVGKTTAMRQLAATLESENRNTCFLNLEDPEYLSFLDENPKNLFKLISLDSDKKTYLFIDEIQYLKRPSNFLKYFFDEYKSKIKIIASGSSSFYIDTKFKDSLVGRKIIFTLQTLSFDEFLRFKGEEKLSQTDLKQLPLIHRQKIISYYEEYMIYGGFPKVVLSPLEEKKDILRDLTFSYIKKDMFESGIRNEEVFYKLLKILASQIGSLLNTSELASTLSVSKNAIDNYIYVMQKSFHISLITPFYKKIRKELTKMPKIYFNDLGLRNFLKNNFSPLFERDDRGELLENSVFREFLQRFYLDEIKFWRTTAKKEVDFIIEERRAFEVKFNSKKIKRKNYEKFSEYYPDVALNFVVFEKDNQFNERVIQPWEI